MHIAVLFGPSYMCKHLAKSISSQFTVLTTSKLWTGYGHDT